MASSKPGLFAREATGLVREIGFILGVIIILSYVIGLGWQKRAFQFTGAMLISNDLLPLALPAMFWAFLISGIVVLITGYAVGYGAAAVPRSGGGYVTISRVIHPVVGYMSGWLIFFAEWFFYGLIGVACFEAIMIVYNAALAPTIIAFDGTTHIIVGLVIFALPIIALLDTKFYCRFLCVMFWISAISTIGFLALSSHVGTLFAFLGVAGTNSLRKRRVTKLNKSERASNTDMPVVSSYLPYLIPNGRARSIRDLGKDLRPFIGFEIKGQDYLIGIIKAVTEYLASSVQNLYNKEPGKARIIANTLQVPIVISIEGRKECFTQQVPLRQIIEDKAEQLSNRVVDSYKKKFKSRISVEQ
jgi:hypothetical protein